MSRESIYHQQHPTSSFCYPSFFYVFLRNYLLLHLLIDLRSSPPHAPRSFFGIDKDHLIFVIDHRFLDLVLVSLSTFGIFMINILFFRFFCISLHVFPFFSLSHNWHPSVLLVLHSARPRRLSAIFEISTRLNANTTMTQYRAIAISDDRRALYQRLSHFTNNSQTRSFGEYQSVLSTGLGYWGICDASSR